MKLELLGNRRIGVLVAGPALVALVVFGIPAGAAEAHPNQTFLIAGTVENPTAQVFAGGIVQGRGTLTAESADFHQETNSYDETDLLAVGSGSLQVVIHGSFSTW